ncbi:MAG TPA: hypothetical protein VF209_05535 [Patescibacteria group bacterium]
MLERTTTIRKPGASREAHVTSQLSENKVNGDDGKTYHAQVNLHTKRGEKKAGQFFVKDLVEGRRWETTLEQQEQKYLRLKKLGLPVLPTFRIDQEKNSLLMTNLSNYKIYDNYHHLTSDEREEVKNIDQVSQQVREIAIKAYDNGNGVILSYDAYTLIVNDQGHAEIKLVDLGFGSFLLTDGKTSEGLRWTEAEALHEANDFVYEIIEGHAGEQNTYFG